MNNIIDKLKGKVAVVTGGGRGIGRAIATRLAVAGADLIVADIDGVQAEKTAEELSKQYQKSISIQLDVTQEKSADALVRIALEEFGKVDILVNNAGIMFRTRLLDISLDEWNNTLLVNLTGLPTLPEPQ